MSSEESSIVSAAGPQKHRACDECRFRKIACSKEPDGCARCRKEGILCHYSLQKPMGRPRKRRLVEDANSPPPAAENPASAAAVVGAPGVVLGYDTAQSQLPTGAYEDVNTLSLFSHDNLGFSQTDAHQNSSFLDLLPELYTDELGVIPHEESPFHFMPAGGQVAFDGSPYPPIPSQGVDLLAGIDFQEVDHSASNLSKGVNDPMHRYMAPQHSSQIPMTTESSPSIQSSSNCFETPSASTATDGSEETSTVKSIPNATCSCLSSLYLALESLSRVHPDVPTAMRVARNASKTAHNVINCPFCYDCMTDPTKPPPIQCFQNLMCIGALVPSACNAYAAILEMIDRETEQAKKENRQLWFSYRELGDVPAGLDEIYIHCDTLRRHNNKLLDPDTWRTTVRTILRIDVYGCEGKGRDDGRMRSPQCLKDVITLLDLRNRNRHDAMDQLIATGQFPRNIPNTIFPGGYKSVPPEQRNCVRVLETARLALNNLSIS